MLYPDYDNVSKGGLLKKYFESDLVLGAQI